MRFDSPGKFIERVLKSIFSNFDMYEGSCENPQNTTVIQEEVCHQLIGRNVDIVLKVQKQIKNGNFLYEPSITF